MNADGIADFAFDPQHLWVVHHNELDGMAPDGSGPYLLMFWETANLQHVATDDNWVYASIDQGELLRVAKVNNATPEVIAHVAGAAQLLTDGGHVYVRGGTLDDSGYHATITRFSPDGSQAVTIADRAGIIGDMAIRGDSDYYVFENDSTVYRVCK